MNKKDLKQIKKFNKKAKYLRDNKALRTACFRYARKRDILGLVTIIEGIVIIGLIISILIL